MPAEYQPSAIGPPFNYSFNYSLPTAGVNILHVSPAYIVGRSGCPFLKFHLRITILILIILIMQRTFTPTSPPIPPCKPSYKPTPKLTHKPSSTILRVTGTLQAISREIHLRAKGVPKVKKIKERKEGMLD